MTERISIPVKIKNVFLGLAECDGILALEKNAITIQYQIQDTVFGWKHSEVEHVSIPLQAIEEVTFSKGIFGNALVIRVRDMKSVSEIPNTKSGEVRLSVARRHTPSALDLVSTVRLLQIADIPW